MTSSTGPSPQGNHLQVSPEDPSPAGHQHEGVPSRAKEFARLHRRRALNRGVMLLATIVLGCTALAVLFHKGAFEVVGRIPGSAAVADLMLNPHFEITRRRFHSPYKDLVHKHHLDSFSGPPKPPKVGISAVGLHVHWRGSGRFIESRVVDETNRFRGVVQGHSHALYFTPNFATTTRFKVKHKIGDNWSVWSPWSRHVRWSPGEKMELSSFKGGGLSI